MWSPLLRTEKQTRKEDPWIDVLPVGDGSASSPLLRGNRPLAQAVGGWWPSQCRDRPPLLGDQRCFLLRWRPTAILAGGSYNAIKRAGGQVQAPPDEHSRSCSSSVPTKRRDKKAPEVEPDSYFLFRYYSVFNAEQADGLPPFDDVAFDNEPIERAETIFLGFIGPTVTFGGDRAFYSPTTDMVRVPMLDQFESAEAYYSTLYHELVHSTGHESRLNRLEAGFGTGPYAKEELVAEMGAAMLCGIAGIENQDQSAAYVAGWLERLRNDPRSSCAPPPTPRKRRSHPRSSCSG